MTTINLYQQSSEGGAEKKSSKMISGGFVYSIGLVILVVLMYLGMMFYDNYLSSRNASMADKVSKATAAFSNQDSVDQVADIQSRIGLITSNINSQPLMTDQLHDLAGNVVSGVAVSSYKQTGNKITVDFLANNFTDISRQILDLKQSPNFANVVVSSLSRGDKNLALEVTMDAVAINVSAAK